MGVQRVDLELELFDDGEDHRDDEAGNERESDRFGKSL
jgi:hypothetical protein